MLGCLPLHCEDLLEDTNNRIVFLYRPLMDSITFQINPFLYLYTVILIIHYHTFIQPTINT